MATDKTPGRPRLVRPADRPRAGSGSADGRPRPEARGAASLSAEEGCLAPAPLDRYRRGRDPERAARLAGAARAAPGGLPRLAGGLLRTLVRSGSRPQSTRSRLSLRDGPS